MRYLQDFMLSVLAKLICCSRSSLETGRLCFVEEINPCRERSFSDASRASFAGLSTLSRVMENGFLLAQPDKNLNWPP